VSDVRLTNKELIERISKTRVDEVFAEYQEVPAAYFCESEDGDRFVLQPHPALHEIFRAREVRQYLFVDEGWLAPGPSVSRVKDITEHPDAFKAVLFKAEDETGIVIAYRKINDKPPSLGPLQTDVPITLFSDEPPLLSSYYAPHRIH